MAKATIEIKRLVYADPDITTDQLIAKLVELGIQSPKSTVQTVKTDFLGSVTVLRELGAFDKAAAPAPVKKSGKPKKKSRAARWSEACSQALAGLETLEELREEYSEWLENTPENLKSSPLGEKLQAVCDLDIEGAKSTVEEAEGVDLPLGFGRD